MEASITRIVIKCKQLRDNLTILQNKMIKERLQDPLLVQTLDNCTLTGFPSILPSANLQQPLQAMTSDYTHLINVGKFITLIKEEESIPTFRNRTSFIQNQLINLLCEIYTTVRSSGGDIPPSLTGGEVPTQYVGLTLTQRFYRDYVIIKDFKLMVLSMISAYR